MFLLLCYFWSQYRLQFQQKTQKVILTLNKINIQITGLLHLTIGGGIPSALHSSLTWLPSLASIG